LRLLLRPDLGGCVAGFWCDGVPLMRSVEDPAALDSVRQSGGFPMLPYGNRIANACFDWQGQTFELRRNFGDHPHAVHGVGWQRAWTVDKLTAAPQAESGAEPEAEARTKAGTESGAENFAEVCAGQPAQRCRLRLVHHPDADWPFAFEAEQTFDLTCDALHWTLSLRNTDTRPQPVGLGWHPYFMRGAGNRLQLQLARRWQSGPTQLPLTPEPVASLDAEAEALCPLDHGFDGWDGCARLTVAGHRLLLESAPNHVVVYVPEGRDIFCVEPMTHLADAIHRADPAAFGLCALAPGKTASLSAHLTVQRPAGD
jgi:aldose 1-epimerase